MSSSSNNVKPQTEQILADLQEEYLSTRSVDSYQRLFTILHSYSRSLILKKTKGKIYLPKELVEDATLEACVRFMQQYQKEDFKIDVSFGGLLNLKILESLYGPKIQQVDKICSLSLTTSEVQKKETEIGDLPETMKFSYLFRPDMYKETTDPMTVLLYKNEDIVKNLTKSLDDMYLKEPLREYMLLALAVILFIRKSKKYEKYKVYYLNPSLNKKLDFYLSKLKDRLQDYA